MTIPFTVTGANGAPVTPQTAAGSVSPASAQAGATFTFTLTGFQRTEQVYYWPTQPDGTVETTRRVAIQTDGDVRAVLE